MNYNTAVKRQPMSFRGGATGFREQGVGTAFLEHLLCAEHYVRCFVSFGIKRTIGPGRYSERRGTDEKIDQRVMESLCLHRGHGG